jgi:hypothetical protein
MQFIYEIEIKNVRENLPKVAYKEKSTDIITALESIKSRLIGWKNYVILSAHKNVKGVTYSYFVYKFERSATDYANFKENELLASATKIKLSKKNKVTYNTKSAR